jgi:hypothetical protein
LTSNEQLFREWERPDLQPLAQRLEIVRNIILQNIKNARANTERIKNVNAIPHDFQVGDRVFISSELDSNRLTNKKHSAVWLGPYMIVDLRNSLVKLVHFYTGRELKNFINVDKLKRLRDTPRDVMYNRHRIAQHPFISDAPSTEQPTIQTSRTTAKDGPQSLTVIRRATVLDDSDIQTDTHGRLTDATTLHDPSELQQHCIVNVHAADDSMLVGSQSRKSGLRSTPQPLQYGSLLLSDHRKQFHLDGITGFDSEGTSLFHTCKDRPTGSFSHVGFQADPRCNNKQASDYMSLSPPAARENESHTRETERHEITLASEHKISPPESRRYFPSNLRESSNLLEAAVTLPPQSQSQPTTNGKPAISLSRDRQAQAQFQATSAATQQDFMGTEGRANEEHYAANTEDETNNLQVTDVADSMTTRIGEQLTGGPSDLTDRPNVTRDISEGETGQH